MIKGLLFPGTALDTVDNFDGRGNFACIHCSLKNDEIWFFGQYIELNTFEI